MICFLSSHSLNIVNIKGGCTIFYKIDFNIHTKFLDSVSFSKNTLTFSQKSRYFHVSFIRVMLPPLIVLSTILDHDKPYSAKVI